MANSVHKWLSKQKHVTAIDKYLLKGFSICKKFLKTNDDILVTKADKGQVTVVMNRAEYVEKMNVLLNDQSTYKKLNKDPVNRVRMTVNELVKSWHEKDIVDDVTCYRLKNTCGNLPRCYGLPKIHKVGYPLRIIVSSIGSPTYNLAAFLHDILNKSIQRPKSHVKDSWTFVNNIRHKNICDANIMISLDVTALFTNIPIDLVMKAVEKRWIQITLNTELTLQQFLHALEVVLGLNSFSFNGEYYEQVFGCPMGSPLSPILADLVMDDLETQCLSTFDFDVPMYYRYVDDIFTIIPKSRIPDVLNAFNNYHQRLRFTYETEVNNSINFLDMNIIRCNGTLITNWYRKPTFSGRYLNFHSNHPLIYKINTIRSLVDHAILLSDERFHTDNIKIVKDILVNNGFPASLARQHINKRIQIIKHRNNSQHTDNSGFDITMCVKIPFIKNVSENVNRTLGKVGLNVVYTIPKKLNRLIKKGKDNIDKMHKTDLVYMINCNDCDAKYIGQTKRQLKTRIKEHSSNIKKHISNYNVISKHRCEFNHEFDWSGTKVLHCEKQRRKREIAEMFLIKKHTNTINLQKDTENLNAVYDNIIFDT